MSTSTRAARALERRCWPLLLSLCRRDAAESLAGGTWRRAPDRAAWEGVARLAARHGVLGLVLSTLDRAARTDGKEESALLALVSRLPQLRRRAALLEMRRDIVAAALREAGVEPVMLKGAALVGTLYEDPVERDILDMDVLVPEGFLKTAVRALAAAGYAGPSSWEELCAFRRYHFHIPMEFPGGPTVEIHWALSRPDAWFRLDGGAVRDRANELVRPGLPVLRVPTAEDMLLHLVLQNVQEGFTRLGRIVDIDRIVASTPWLDWNALSAEAREGNLEPALALSLHLARQLLGTPTPPAVLVALRPGAASRFHLAALHALRAAPPDSLLGPAGRHMMHLWLLPIARQRQRMLLGLLAPAPVMPSLKTPPGLFRRMAMLAKMAVVQAAIVGAAPVLLAPPSRREAGGLWSR